MRIAVLSDIHGNQLALEAVLRDLEGQERCDQLIVAGDLCLNGPRPREVLQMVQDLHCPVIQGNTDLEMVTQAPEKGEKKRIVVSWTLDPIGQSGIDYLAWLAVGCCCQLWCAARRGPASRLWHSHLAGESMGGRDQARALRCSSGGQTDQDLRHAQRGEAQQGFIGGPLLKGKSGGGVGC